MLNNNTINCFYFFIYLLFISNIATPYQNHDQNYNKIYILSPQSFIVNNSNLTNHDNSLLTYNNTKVFYSSMNFLEMKWENLLNYSENSPITYNPSFLKKTQLNDFKIVYYPTTIKKLNYSISREQENLKEFRDQIYSKPRNTFLLRDPWDSNFDIHASNWPYTNYDMNIVSREWQAQLLTPRAIDLEIRWTLMGGMLEFHRPEKFLNRLHIHLFPAEEPLVQNIKENFEITENIGLVNVGTVKVSIKNIALKSKDPIAFKNATFSLANFLQSDNATWFYQAIVFDQKSKEWITYFPIFNKKSVPFGIRAFGTITTPDEKLLKNPSEIIKLNKNIWLDDSEIKQLKNKWLNKTNKTDFSSSLSSHNYFSNFTKDLLIKNSDYETILQSIRSNIKTNIHQFSAKDFNGKEPDLILTYHGRIAPLKNLTVFIETAKWLAGYFKYLGKNLRVEIRGGGDRHDTYKKYLNDLIKLEGLESIINFFGDYDNNNLSGIYDKDTIKRRIYFAPGEDETFGLACLEALRLKIPVVCSDQDAVKEMVKGKMIEYDAGIILPVKGLSIDEKSRRYALAIMEIFIDPLKWKKMSQNAMNASIRYQSDEMAAKYRSLFEKISHPKHGENKKIEYLSPGLFPYENGGIAQWARNLFQELMKDETSHFNYYLKSQIPNFKSNICIENEIVLNGFTNFEPVNYANLDLQRPSFEEYQNIILLFKILIGRIMNIKNTDNFSKGFTSFQTNVEDLELLEKIQHVFLQYNHRFLIGTILSLVSTENITDINSINMNNNEILEFINFFNFLRTPFTERDIFIVDSPNCFGLSAILSKHHFNKLKANKSHVLFIQHSRGSEVLYNKYAADFPMNPKLRIFKKNLFLFFLRLYYDHSDKIIAVSQLVIDDLKSKYNISSEKIVLITNGIDFGLNPQDKTSSFFNNNTQIFSNAA